MLTGSDVVLSVDHDQPVRPSAGDPLGCQEGRVCDRSSSSIEVETVRGIDDDRSPLGRQPSSGVPGDERRDRRVDVDDVVAGLDNFRDGPFATHQAPRIEHRSREGELVDVIERGMQDGLTGDTVGGRIDPPAERPEMGCVRHEKVADSVRHGRDEQE